MLMIKTATTIIKVEKAEKLLTSGVKFKEGSIFVEVYQDNKEKAVILLDKKQKKALAGYLLSV